MSVPIAYQIRVAWKLCANCWFQIKKALELYEQLRQRMGVVIVGPSGSGKSIIWRILRAALSKMKTEVKQYVMNPKAMPRQQVSCQW